MEGTALFIIDLYSLEITCVQNNAMCIHESGCMGISHVVPHGPSHDFFHTAVT